MATTEVLVGVICGISAGILVGIIYWVIYRQWKKRTTNSKQGRGRRKYEEVKQSLIIKPSSIPAFKIPIHPQEPVVSPPANGDSSSERLIIPKNVRVKRRGTVPLDELNTDCAQVRRKLSPASPPSDSVVQAINRSAIENLNIQRQKKKAFSRSSTSPLGKLEFSLFYDQDFQNLQVHIIRGSQVFPPGNVEDLMELVVSVAVVFDGKQTWHDKTMPTEASTNPDFNEQLAIHGITSNQMRVGTLKLTLINNINDSPISVAFYPLSTVPYNFLINETVRLNDAGDIDEGGLWDRLQDGDEPNNGELLVSMLHRPSDKKLTVEVESARDLPPGNRGPPDSYVKVDILFLGSALYSRKTKVVPKSCHPEYNETFEFDIDDDKLHQVMVILKVKNRGKMRNTKIGIIRLGYTADPHEPQYRHWEQVLHHPYLNIEKWHAIGKQR